MDDNSLVNVNDRNYVDPNKSIEETNAFIDNLRNVQNQNNEQITTETRNLGSDVPMSQGGLVGSGDVWRDRFQNTQVNNMINNLRATTQASALQTQLQNELAQKQREYKLAYRDQYKRAKARAAAAAARAAAAGSGGYGTPQGNVEVKSPTAVNDDENPSVVSSHGSGTTTIYDLDGRLHVFDENMQDQSAQSQTPAQKSGIWGLW